MKTALGIVMLAAAFAAGTAAVGWWAVPVIAFAWGWIADRAKRPALVAGTSALVGWGLLVLWDATGPAFRDVAAGVGAVLKTSASGFVEISLLFPLVVAMAAAGAANALRSER